jgi:predicted NBD/HSP70 family sugar kinase
MTGTFPAIDLGATHLRVAIVDIGSARILEHLEVKTPDRADDAAQLLVRMFEELRIEPGDIGVAAAPQIDVSGVITRWPNRPAYVGSSVFHRLAANGFRLQTIDDGLAACVAEDRGAPSGTATVYLGLGTGVAGGAVVDGEPLAGAHDAAMDIGHLFVTEARQLACACGRSGCLQMVVSGRAIERAAFEEGVSIDEFVARFSAGDTRTSQLLESVARALAQAIAAVVCIIDPARLVVGGRLASPMLIDRTNGCLEEFGISRLARPAVFGAEAPLIGAALRAAKNRLFREEGSSLKRGRATWSSDR